MSLQEIYYIAEMVVGLAVIISIIFVAIELRQNTYMLKKSMADQREERFNWVTETLATNNEFRQYALRIGQEWDQFNDDDRMRGIALGTRTLRSLLNELVAYFDGQITDDEFRNLKWNMVNAKARQHDEAAYMYVKDGYPRKVQKYWEGLDMSNSPSYAFGELLEAGRA